MNSNGYSDKVKRGYLNEDFHFFRLKDQKKNEFEYHYHDFNKIIIFLSGEVTYLIEGKSYILKPWDILLVGHK
jgi:quercetin dioxygenase-like cupin family protein